jgi:hypothetical protein
MSETIKPIRPETLVEFCERWNVPLSWGYRYTRMKGEKRLPHIKAGKYIRVIPEEGDSWMQRLRQN